MIIYRWLHRHWCGWFHKASMLPIHGKYVCSICLEEYPIEFEQGAIKR